MYFGSWFQSMIDDCFDSGPVVRCNITVGRAWQSKAARKVGEGERRRERQTDRDAEDKVYPSRTFPQ